MSFFRWLMQRVTALVLVVCLGVHTVVMHFTHGSAIDLIAVTDRLHNPLWFIFYLVFLASTMFHVLNGVYEVINDYRPGPVLKLLVMVAFWGAGVIATGWGMYALINYNKLIVV